ncbi:MAG: alpha/beta hydrolase [Pseudomonadota bacterium]
MEKPTLVLLPGMDGTGNMFAPFVAAMGGLCNTLCIRYPDDVAMGYAELEALVRSQLPHNTRYVVLGESFSGPIAASLSAAPPPGLIGVVLCCTFLRNPRPQLAVFGGLLKFAPLKAAPIAAMVPVLLGRYSTAALRTALSNALAQVSTVTLQARLRAVLQVDVRAHLAAAKIPVLYLRAKQDYLLPARATAEVQASLPSVEMQSIAGPHLLLQACPVPAAAAVSRFMRSLASATFADYPSAP